MKTRKMMLMVLVLCLCGSAWATTYTNHLSMAKPADGSEAWGNELRQNSDVLDHLLNPEYMIYVGKNFTTANLANGAATDRRYFDTIQDAIDQVEGYTPTYGSLYTIMVYPGEYYENLTITRSLTIVAANQIMPSSALGGGTGVKIRGQTAVQDPMITIDPVDGVFVVVTISGIYFEQAYNQAATYIDDAYFLRVDRPATYGGYANRVYLKDCSVRGQTWGAGNEWKAGIYAEGWVDVYLSDCMMSGMGYAGGSNNGGIRNLIYLWAEGVTSGNKSSVRVWGGSYENVNNATSGASVFRVFASTTVPGTAYARFYRTNMYLSAPNSLPGQVIYVLDGAFPVVFDGWTDATERLEYMNTISIRLNDF